MEAVLSSRRASPTGLIPAASHTTTSYSLAEEWRRHCIAVILTSHLGGDQLDTCNSDHELNRVAFDHPGKGHRVVNVWDRNSTGKIFAITDDYGGEDAVTTIMWADEY